MEDASAGRTKLPDQRILTHRACSISKAFRQTNSTDRKKSKSAGGKLCVSSCAETEENMENTKKMGRMVEQADGREVMSTDEKFDLILHELREMKEEINGIKAEVGGMKEEMKEMKEEINGIKEEIKEIKAEINEMHAQIDRLDLRVSDLERTIYNINSAIAGVREEAGEIKAEISGMRTDMNVLNIRVSALESEMKDIRGDINGMKDDMGRIKSEIGSIRNEISGLKEDIQELKRRVRNVELLIENELREHIMKIAEGHMNLKMNLDDAVKPVKEIERLTLRVGILESDVRGLKEKLA